MAGATLQLTELACDTDVEYFQDWGSVAAVESRINSIVNTVNLQYESQVAIRHEITTILIRSSEPDPYSSSSSSTLLNQFRNEWLNNQAGVPRDVAHLFTGKEIIGSTIGEAWTIGGICTTGAYCHAQSDCCGSFACATDLTAHELGHLWGAFHCSCPANTMNPTINCSNLFSAGTITDIVNHRNTRTCLETFEPGGDCNDNGVPDSTDIATGFSDDCNNNDIPDECETGAAEYADSLGAPLAIPDGSGQFVSNAISVPTSGTITDIDVDLQISHTWNGDLTVRLQKGGTQIDLIDRPGIPGSTFGYDNDGYDITLDDEGTGGPIETENSGGPAVTSPPSYVPNDALSAFDGLNQAGTWTISVSDSVGQDAGSLVGWSLKITTDGGGVAPCDVPNDDCADATVVGVGSHPFSTAGALTDGPDESVNCGFPFGMSQVQNDVWFEYTASCLGTVVIGVCDADFDVALVVYDDGCPSTSLESAYCSSNDCNATGAEVSFIAAPGQTFLVRVGSLDDVIGAGTLDIDCTPFSVCGNGSIDPGEECDDGNLVNGDGCDAGCQLECRADGTPCDDRDPCTTDDMFIDCECVGVPLDCDDGIPCTFDECVDGVCVNTPNDALCDNGLYCDGVEVCVAGVGCMAGTPVLCNDGNPCTDDVCDEVNDTCIFPANSAPCDDGDPCTVNDTCSGGNCAGTPLDCDDGDPCTDDSCVDGTCVNVPNGTCCPQDCDGSGDGIVGVSDLLALLGDWGGPGPCDLDGNGTVGVGDLLDLLGAWGPCR